MERFTQKQLDFQVECLNAALNRPRKAWRKVGGRNVASVGRIVLDQCYGGYRVAELCTDGGGERDMFHGYRMSARECYYCLKAAVEAVRAAVGSGRFAKRMRRMSAT